MEFSCIFPSQFAAADIVIIPDRYPGLGPQYVFLLLQPCFSNYFRVSGAPPPKEESGHAIQPQWTQQPQTNSLIQLTAEQAKQMISYLVLLVQYEWLY